MSTAIASAGSLFLLLLALGGEAVLGEMRWLFARVPHPRLLIGEAVEFLERRLNRPGRGPRNRLVRGALATVAVLVLAAGAGALVHGLARALPWLWPVEWILAMSLIAQRGPYRRVAEAARAIGAGGLVAGQEALRPLAGIAPGGLDGAGLGDTVRVGALALARALVHGVVAPCFWFVLIGLPGLFLQQAALVLAARLKGGQPGDPRYGDFGMAAGRLNETLTLIPAGLATLMLALAAAFVPHGRPGAALAAARRAGSPGEPGPGPAGLGQAGLGQAGLGPRAGSWPGAAMLGALGPDHAGPDGGHEWGAVELERARLLYIVACLINAGAIAALALLMLSL